MKNKLLLIVSGLFGICILTQPFKRVEAAYVPSAIKSVQAVSITFGGSSNTGTATLSPSVIAANSLLVYNGGDTSDNNSSLQSVQRGYGVITNGTTVTATRANNDSGTTSAIWTGTVVEFGGSFIKSSGCYAITIPADGVSTTATQTITSVNTAKTLISYTGTSVLLNQIAWIGGLEVPRIALTNATTLTASRHLTNGSSVTTTVGTCYVEFK